MLTLLLLSGEPDFSTFTSRLRWAMDQAGKTNMSALAREIKVTPQSIQYLCEPKNNASGSEHVTKLARALNVRADWLATGRGPVADLRSPTPGGYADQFGISPSLSKDLSLIEQYAKTPEEREEWIAEVRSYHVSEPRKEYLAGKTSNDQPQELEIPQFETGGAMGHGLILRDQPGIIHGWRVNAEWIQKNVRHHSGAKNLCIVTGFGDSMRPMYNPGDPLLVDSGVKTVDFDSVYFFRVGDEGFVKRLQRIPGDGIRVLSENKSYEPWTIKPDMDFQVFGRVLKAWKGEDF